MTPRRAVSRIITAGLLTAGCYTSVWLARDNPPVNAGSSHQATSPSSQWSTVMINNQPIPCLNLSTDARTWPANVIPPGYYAYLTKHGAIDHRTLSCLEPVVNDNDPTAPDAFAP